MSDQGLQAVAKGLKKCVLMEDISLGFGLTSIEQDKTMEQFAEALQGMKGLKKLAFVAFKTNILDLGFL